MTDGPFVESGDKWMAFHWKDGKDKLLARSGHLPKSVDNLSSLSGNPWTTFSMALREPSLLEGPLELARFFVTSITFMRTVKKIEMLVDGISVLEVEKVVKRKEKAERGGLNTMAAGGMMTVTSVDVTDMVITAKVMKWLEGVYRHRVAGLWLTRTSCRFFPSTFAEHNFTICQTRPRLGLYDIQFIFWSLHFIINPATIFNCTGSSINYRKCQRDHHFLSRYSHISR